MMWLHDLERTIDEVWDGCCSDRPETRERASGIVGRWPWDTLAHTGRGGATGVGKDIGFEVNAGTTPAPPIPLKQAAGTQVASESPNVLDPAQRCRQTGLPAKPKQVEWAADQAIKGTLLARRKANWHGNGLLEPYTPQQLFIPLAGGDGTGQVPARVLLGILGQESNLWQASRHAMPGEYGNPLVGSFYGLDLCNADPSDDWAIRWDKADCGYGVSQLIDGMQRADTVR